MELRGPGAGATAGVPRLVSTAMPPEAKPARGQLGEACPAGPCFQTRGCRGEGKASLGLEPTSVASELATSGLGNQPRGAGPGTGQRTSLGP